MLILSRGYGEKITIGDSITVTVLEIQGGKVRIGIECPREIPVHRLEVYEKIQLEKQNGEQHQV